MIIFIIVNQPSENGFLVSGSASGLAGVKRRYHRGQAHSNNLDAYIIMLVRA